MTDEEINRLNFGDIDLLLQAQKLFNNEFWGNVFKVSISLFREYELEDTLFLWKSLRCPFSAYIFSNAHQFLHHLYLSICSPPFYSELAVLIIRGQGDFYELRLWDWERQIKYLDSIC